MTTNTQTYLLRMSIRDPENDNLLFSNEDNSKPLMEVTLGEGKFFPKIEAMLPSMEKGEEKSVLLEKEEAFGEVDDAAVKKIPVNEIPEELRNKGENISVEIADDNVIQGKIVDLDPESATIDFNHPLAGERIKIDFKLVEIK